MAKRKPQKRGPKEDRLKIERDQLAGSIRKAFSAPSKLRPRKRK